MQMMSAEGVYGKSIEKAFTFKVEDYDMVRLFYCMLVTSFAATFILIFFLIYQIDCIPHLART
jgi:hypothetical protein